MAKNAKEEGVQTLPSGLQYKVIQSGPAGGARPDSNDLVKVDYEGALIDGTVFDSSLDRGEPATFPLARPFHVIATANPVEHEGTYQLPEAQLDRFLMRISFGYPSPEDEWDVVARRVARRTEEQTVPAVTDAAGLLSAQAAVEGVDVDPSVGRYAVALAVATLGIGLRRDAPEAIFAIARIAGWIAHAIEEYQEKGLRFRVPGIYAGVRPHR